MRDPREVLTRPGRPPDLTLAYGSLPEHVVDVRLPKGDGPAALVVVVHGGFWRAAYDRAHAAAQGEGLADAGYVTATVEYRRTGMPGGAWPGTFDDTAAWSDRVTGLVSAALTERSGMPRLRPDSTVLVGHSAGGHLAAWAASRARLPVDSPWHRAQPLPGVVGVVSLAGVLDLAECVRLNLDDGAAQALLRDSGGNRSETGVVDQAELSDRLPLADPAQLLPAAVRFTVIHGTADDRVPVEIARSYVDRAALPPADLEANRPGDAGVSSQDRRGEDVVLRELEGIGHFELIDPLSSAWPDVLAAIDELLR